MSAPLQVVGGPAHGQTVDWPHNTWPYRQPEMPTPGGYCSPAADPSPITRLLETTYVRDVYRRVSAHPCVRELVMVETWEAWTAQGRPHDEMVRQVIAEVPRKSIEARRQHPHRWDILPTWYGQP